MSFSEVISSLPELTRAERVRLLEHLVADLAADKDVGPIEDGAAYPVWTPLGATGAADTLLRAIDERQEAR